MDRENKNVMGKKKKIVASVQDPDLEWKIVVEYKL
jgi:hypothetical protein